MTAALLLLVLLLAGTAATVTHHHHRRPRTIDTEDRTMTATTRTTELPEGYDDPSGLHYVPELLRPFWDDAPMDRLEARDAADRWDTEARADVLRRDPTWRAKLLREGGRWYDIDSRPSGLLLRDAYGDGAATLPPMSPAEQDRAEHLTRLTAAGERRAAAEAAERAEQQRRDHACPICSQPRAYGSPSGPGSDSRDAALCAPCRVVVAAERVATFGADTVRDGHTRAELARGWLTS